MNSCISASYRPMHFRLCRRAASAESAMIGSACLARLAMPWRRSPPRGPATSPRRPRMAPAPQLAWPIAPLSPDLRAPCWPRCPTSTCSFDRWHRTDHPQRRRRRRWSMHYRGARDRAGHGANRAGRAICAARVRVAPAARLARRRPLRRPRPPAALAVQPRWFISGLGPVPADRTRRTRSRTGRMHDQRRAPSCRRSRFSVPIAWPCCG